jgi:predicted O-methyltransferase YrrM
LEVKLSKIVYDYIEDYIRGMIIQRDDTLKRMELFAEQNHIPIIQPEVAKFLSFILKTKKAASILEVGTAIGYSAMVMYNSSGGCRIITIERDDEMIKNAEENINTAGLGNNIQIIKGDAEEVLSNMNDKFDFILLDAAKGQYLELFQHCDRMLNINGIIFADNVLFRGMVANNELLIRRKITIVKRMRKYLKFMTENENYETSILPLGDGVAVSIKIGG